jgi:hypothetical protein
MIDRIELGYEANARIELDNQDIKDTLENLDLDFITKNEKAVLSEFQVERKKNLAAISLVYNVYFETDEDSLRYLRRYERIVFFKDNKFISITEPELKHQH